MVNARNDVDLRGFHPALAKAARKLFRLVRRDSRGRLSADDMRVRFGRHADAMLDAPGDRADAGWAFLCGRWGEALKDWGVETGVSGRATGGEG